MFAVWPVPSKTAKQDGWACFLLQPISLVENKAIKMWLNLAFNTEIRLVAMAKGDGSVLASCPSKPQLVPLTKTKEKEVRQE